jgi:hypothetical protein
VSGTSYTRNYLSQKNLGTLRHSTILRRILWVVLIGYTTEMVHLLPPLNARARVCVYIYKYIYIAKTVMSFYAPQKHVRNKSCVFSEKYEYYYDTHVQTSLESFLLLEFALSPLVIGVARVLQCVQLYITTQLLLPGCQQKLHASPPSATSNCHRNYLNTIATVFNIMLSTIYCLRVDVVAYNVQKHVIL